MAASFMAAMPTMNKLAPFLWLNDNAEEAAEFYLRRSR